MSNFRGYYIRIGDYKFDDPAIKRDGLHVQPHLVQTSDSGVLASGKLLIKVLPHTRTKIEVIFPIMTPEQFQRYYKAVRDVDKISPNGEMYLPLEYYNQGIDQYETGIFYHNDIGYKPVKYQGKEMIEVDDIHFIEH